MAVAIRAVVTQIKTWQSEECWKFDVAAKFVVYLSFGFDSDQIFWGFSRLQSDFYSKKIKFDRMKSRKTKCIRLSCPLVLILRFWKDWSNSKIKDL